MLPRSKVLCRGITVSMCHPGPIATGTVGQVRSLYGSDGLLTELEDQAKVKQRQSPQRVAQLILRAVYHELDSCWISQHPVLLLGKPSSPPRPSSQSASPLSLALWPPPSLLYEQSTVLWFRKEESCNGRWVLTGRRWANFHSRNKEGYCSLGKGHFS